MIIKFNLTNITSEQKSFKGQWLQDKDRTALDEEVKKKRETLKTSLAELRPMIGEVTKKYTELRADASVKTAISELQGTTKANFKLGPSEAFQSGAKLPTSSGTEIPGEEDDSPLPNK